MDLFGKALLAFYRGHSDASIKLIRDDGWEDDHSPGLYFEPDPFDFERPALALIKGPTIDVGCGAGRHLKWLDPQGHKAFGVDISEGAVEVCHAQGIKAVECFDILSDRTPSVPFTPRNISLFGNNVGIGGTFEGSTTLFQNLHHLCAEDGQLVLTGIDVRKTDNAQHIAYQEQNVARGRRRGEITIKVSFEDKVGPNFNWFHPEPKEIEELGSLTGWKIEKLERCGNFFWSSLRRS